MPPVALIGVMAVVLFTPRSAWAYVDPGAGSMLLQLLLGGAAGLLVALKLFYRRIAMRLGLRHDAEGEPSSDADLEP